MERKRISIISLITPVLLHMALSFAAGPVIRAAGVEDTTAATVAAAVLTIPLAYLMYRKDCGNSGRNERNTKENKSRTAEVSLQKAVCFGIFCFVSGGVLNLVWSALLNAVHITEIFSNEVQERLLQSDLLLQIFGLGIAVPIAEELIFRALVYRRMKHIFPVGVSMVLSALLFAVYHGNPIQMIFAFPMAIALAAVYEHGKLFLFPVLFHAGANMAAIALKIFAKI